MMQDATAAYDKAKEIHRLCAESKTVEEAKRKVAERYPVEDLAHIVDGCKHWIGK